MITSSLIVCTRNRPDDIVKLIPSVYSQNTLPQEFIIVDSSPIPLSQQHNFQNLFRCSFYKTMRLIYIHTDEAGTSHQRNRGARYTQTDILHFVDDDTILNTDYIAQMNDIFIQHSHYAGGMGTVINVPSKTYTPDRFMRILFFLQRDHSSGNFTWSGMPTHAYGTDRFKNVEVLGGCCMSYRRSIFLDYLFDENLGQYAYMEDADLSWRVSRTHKLFYNPTARLVHTKSLVNRAKQAEQRKLFIKNYRYLFFKNIYPISKIRILAYWWSLLGLSVIALISRSRQSLDKLFSYFLFFLINSKR